jgi:hypothetical protein
MESVVVLFTPFMNKKHSRLNTEFMLTELKASIESIESAYYTMRIGKTIFVARSIFVIAQVRIISEKKFTVKPFNIFGLLNAYLMMGKYHLYYKMLEDDVLYALRQSARRNISIVLG